MRITFLVTTAISLGIISWTTIQPTYAIQTAAPQSTGQQMQQLQKHLSEPTSNPDNDLNKDTGSANSNPQGQSNTGSAPTPAPSSNPAPYSDPGG